MYFLWSDKPKPKIYRTTKNLESFSKVFKLEIWPLPLNNRLRTPKFNTTCSRLWWEDVFKGYSASYHSRIDNFPSKVSEKILNLLITMSDICLFGLITVFSSIWLNTGAIWKFIEHVIIIETILLSRGHRMLKS